MTAVPWHRETDRREPRDECIADGNIEYGGTPAEQDSSGRKV